MIRITPTITIDENELKEEFVRASGPGGQNVNKVATTVQLRFNIIQSSSLTQTVKDRLVKLAGRRINNEGILVIQAGRFRTQDKNRKDALERLCVLVRQAAEKPKPRHKTKPTFASKKRRLNNKRQRGRLKKNRSGIRDSEE